MNIAVFSDNFYPETSGISESIMNIGQALAERGHHIQFFVPRYSRKNFAHIQLPYQEINLGPNITMTRFYSVPFNIGTKMGRMVLPAGWIWPVKKFRPDVIHVHVPFGMGLEGLLAAKVLRVPMVGTNHTPAEFTRGWLPRGLRWIADLHLWYSTWFYNYCDFLSSPAAGMFEEMQKLHSAIPRQIVSNPLKTDFFVTLNNKAELKKKYNFKDFTVLFIGRLSKEKNVDQLIRAAAQLKQVIPQLTVAIASTGPAEVELRQLTTELGVQDSVQFLGFLSELSLREVYNAADVFVMPSTAESQSLSSMEAMLCGLPVVAARSMGLEQYLKPEAGFIIEPGDIAVLTEKIIYLYNNPTVRTRMGAAARQSVEHLSREEVATIWEQIYTKTIERYRSR